MCAYRQDTDASELFGKALGVAAIAGLSAVPTAVAFLMFGQLANPPYSLGGTVGYLPAWEYATYAILGIPNAVILAPSCYLLVMRHRPLWQVILTQWAGAFLGGLLGAVAGGTIGAWIAASLGLIIAAAVIHDCPPPPDRQVRF